MELLQHQILVLLKHSFWSCNSMKMCCTCTFLELLQLQTVCNFYNYTYNGVIKALGMGAAVTMLLQVQLSLLYSSCKA